MALIQCDFFSESLALSCSMNVILPQATTAQIGMKGVADAKRHPTLWLLHGMSDDHTIWLRRTSIERYVTPLGIAVVMPAVAHSYYTDMHHGPRYWQFISEELPALARSFFPLSDAREDNFVAGLSMGGYGAMKLALTHPDRYAVGASLSGALDIGKITNHLPERNVEMINIFGQPDQIAGSPNDLFALASNLAASKSPRPRLYQCCGADDFLYQDNLRFRDHLRTLDIELTYEEDAGFGHAWEYWDLTIQRVLKFIRK
jgi:S-formylglutathione hydrolase FrmB